MKINSSVGYASNSQMQIYNKNKENSGINKSTYITIPYTQDVKFGGVGNKVVTATTALMMLLGTSCKKEFCKFKMIPDDIEFIKSAYTNEKFFNVSDWDRAMPKTSVYKYDDDGTYVVKSKILFLGENDVRNLKKQYANLEENLLSCDDEKQIEYEYWFLGEELYSHLSSEGKFVALKYEHIISEKDTSKYSNSPVIHINGIYEKSNNLDYEIIGSDGELTSDYNVYDSKNRILNETKPIPETKRKLPF